MKVFQREQQLRTTGGLHVRDITDDVAEAVQESGVQDGIACVYSPHTTCCVRVNEFEQGFLEDFAQLLCRLVPRETYYAHDDWDRRTENICPEDMDFGNGHSHCMAMLLGTAGESIPIRNGELQLGTWQRVLFLELDRERDRRWIVQVVGTSPATGQPLAPPPAKRASATEAAAGEAATLPAVTTRPQGCGDAGRASAGPLVYSARASAGCSTFGRSSTPSSKIQKSLPVTYVATL